MQRDSVVDIAKNIKLSVSMNDLLDRYGIKKNQSGFICCPFHAGDDTPSLKIYDDGKGWYCFGCEAGSSVIDFVMKFEKLTFMDACKKIDEDFKLGFFTHKISRMEKMMKSIKRDKEKKEKIKLYEAIQTAENDYFNAMIIVDNLERNIKELAPKSPEDEYDGRFVYACKNIATAKDKLEFAEYRWKELCQKI